MGGKRIMAERRGAGWTCDTEAISGLIKNAYSGLGFFYSHELFSLAYTNTPTHPFFFLHTQPQLRQYDDDANTSVALLFFTLINLKPA